MAYTFRALNAAGKAGQLRQRGSPSGRPRCLICKRVIPLRQSLANSRPIFCTNACAVLFANRVADTLVVQDARLARVYWDALARSQRS